MLWLLCALLALAVLALLGKLWLLRKSLYELRAELEECLRGDTNVLLSVSSRDRAVRLLAAELNRQLRLLRSQRWRYRSGDRELKEAVTNISHDLRTPLTAICGYLDLLEREEKSPEVARCLALIENRAQVMKQLTEELFRYSMVLSAQEGGEGEAVALNSCLEESIAAHYAALKARGIHPEIRLPEEKILRRLDRTALGRVFGNLFSNVLKYSDGDLEIELTPEGEVVFSNTASGLDEVQVGRLFDRFYTVEAAHHSTGLGLAIARTLVERMGGEISARYQRPKLYVCIRFPEE